ncbi:MAG TPA: M36 family metallopeptidase [Saprospiraceae bacterium]|nr:M36 family metallopeptidase [Saprospiraceae bacterium]
MKQLSLYLIFTLFSFGIVAQKNESWSQFLQRDFPEFKEEIHQINCSSFYYDRAASIWHVYFEQKYREVKVFPAVFSCHYNDHFKLIYHSASPITVAQLKKQYAKLPAQNSSVKNELFQKLYVKKRAETDPSLRENQVVLLKAEFLFFKESEQQLVPAIQFDIEEKNERKSFLYNLENNELLSEWSDHISCDFGVKSGKIKQTFFVKNNHQGLPPAPKYTVFAQAIQDPDQGSRTVVTDPSTKAPNASPLGWHDDGLNAYTLTKGNNVDAYEDFNGDNIPNLGNNSRADAGSSMNFDFPFSPTSSPIFNIDAAITNMFYWSNLMHDVSYQYGFDELAGNFQNYNFARGGQGSDYFIAEAMDDVSNARNNANIAVGSDGISPRMQMYLWDQVVFDDIDILSPSNIAGKISYVRAGFSPDISTAISSTLVLADDGSSDPTYACNPLVNAAQVSGKIVLIDQGVCSASAKVARAQAANAIAVVICNNFYTDPVVIGGFKSSANIPVVMISKSDCERIKLAIQSGVQIKINPRILATPVERDGCFESAIVCHEYGHGISFRLTGGPSNVSCLFNAESGSEGWSDFFGLWMTMKPTDYAYQNRGVGNWTMTQATGDHGIRPYPYSVSLSANPATYDQLLDYRNYSQPHGIGYIWCSMLWDLNWALIGQYGFEPNVYLSSSVKGNIRAMQLIMMGLKLQVCSPGFVDARNAILQADSILYGASNATRLWNVFARRGLGYSANQGSSSRRNDQVSAYDLPPGVTAMTESQLFGSVVLASHELNLFPQKNKELKTVTFRAQIDEHLQGYPWEIEKRNPVSLTNKTTLLCEGKFSYFPCEDSLHEDKMQYRLKVSKLGVDYFSEWVDVQEKNLILHHWQIQPTVANEKTVLHCVGSYTGKINLSLADLSGQRIEQKLLYYNLGDQIEIYLHQLPVGAYLLTLQDMEGDHILKIIKGNE